MTTRLRDQLQEALGDAYRVERELARGGMSYLFLATEVSLNRRIVVKVLPPETASEVSAARFRQEIEVAAHLHHPHILPVLTTGARDNLLFFTMPFVEGESLRHRMERDGRLPVAEAVRILRETADALAYAHGHGVVHRDIKPENILLLEGHAVLADFGVARAFEQARTDTRLTAAGAAIGTPGYMSPEQAAGEPHIDARADLYALAVVGYEMLSGKPPFGGTTLQALITAHLTEIPTPIEELRPEVPAAVSHTLARALEKEPAERIQSAAELRDALAGTDTPLPPMPPAPPPRRSAGLAAGVVAAVMVAGAAFAFWPRGYTVDGDPRQSLIVFPFDNQTGDIGHDYLENASMNLLGLAVGHWDDLRLFDDERTASLMRRRGIEEGADLDFANAQRMAREAGVGTLVLGDIRREGALLAVEAKVHDVVTGERIATEVVRGSPDDPRPLYDSLASRILRISGAPPGAAPGIVTQTTTNLEAYRAYLAGTQALQRFRIDSAEQQLERAIALDSNFALAYIQLRNVIAWRGAGDPERQRALVAAAEGLSDRLPSRQRQLVQFHAAYEDGDFRRARGIANDLLGRDSTDVEIWYQLGEAHWHGGGTTYPRPRPDTLGNLGKALHAFRQALAHDSSYGLAYQHLTDAVGNCAGWTNIICTADSAIYGTEAQLRTLVGNVRYDRLREEAERSLLRTAYEWVAAAPNVVRARTSLLNLLLSEERFDEALGQARVFRSQGHVALAGALEARVAYQRRNFREASDLMAEAVRLAPDSAASETGLQANTFDDAGEMLAAGGRLDEGIAAASLRTMGFDADSLGGPAGRQPKAFYAEARRFLLEAHYATDSARARDVARAWLDFLDGTLPDAGTRNGLISNHSWAFLSTYLLSRDSLVLRRLVDAQDTANALSWRVAAAHLALERGDTADARRRLGRDFRTPHQNEFLGIFGVARGAAWADLLARLGAYRDAERTWAMLDTLDGIRAGLQVKAWAERGALLQRLGENDAAAQLYRRVIDAWGRGDLQLRDVVARAERALATLEGRTTPSNR